MLLIYKSNVSGIEIAQIRENESLESIYGANGPNFVLSNILTIHYIDGNGEHILIWKDGAMVDDAK